MKTAVSPDKTTNRNQNIQMSSNQNLVAQEVEGSSPFYHPIFDSSPCPDLGLGFFYFHAKPLVVKGFAKQYPISWILRREPLPGGLAHDFNEKRPKFSGRLEQATLPRRSPENRLNEKHTPV